MVVYDVGGHLFDSCDKAIDYAGKHIKSKLIIDLKDDEYSFLVRWNNKGNGFVTLVSSSKEIEKENPKGLSMPIWKREVE